MKQRYFSISLLAASLVLGACSEPDVPVSKTPDAEAIGVNNHAVGLMGRFEYAEAHGLFEELAAKWPGWHDVSVNLAIATLNRQQAGDEQRALEIAGEVLQADPENLRARYLSGLVQLYLGSTPQAMEAFRHVTGKDPEDAHAAYYLGQCLAQLGEYESAEQWFQKALKLDPYLRSAYYGAFQAMQRLGRPDEANALAADYQRLEKNPRSHLAEFKYTRMGEKGNALATNINSEPVRPVPEGPLFAARVPVLINNPSEIDWRKNFQGHATSITTVDIQADGVPDLFLSGVTRLAGSNGNLVLEGQPGGGYSALTSHPLSNIDAVNAALWGDFDNDGLVDVYLCRDGLNQLWRQIETGNWQDVTASSLTAGADLDTVDGAFFDADHDGDLDLFLVNGNGPNELLNNNLDGTFRPLAESQGLTGAGTASLMVLPVDIDNDRDADLVILNRDAPHEVFLNDRLWSYHRSGAHENFSNSPAHAVLAADIDVDGIPELYTLGPNGTLTRWSEGTDGQFQAQELAAPGALKSMNQPRMATHDINGDGVPDFIISSSSGWMVLGLDTDTAQPLFAEKAMRGSTQLASLALTGVSRSGPAMLVLYNGDAGLQFWSPGEGRYPFINLSFSGRQDDAQSMRSNASGVGTRLAVRTESRWSLLQNFRNYSGPGQSLQPTVVGLKGSQRADFLSIDWSDGVFQSEVAVETGQLHEIAETQRQLSSCPVLFAWDGEKFAFVSDFLGVGGMGFAIAPGEYATPRPRESFLLPNGLLKEKDQRYILKVAEPMEENAYLDAARLVVYDLPPGWQVVMDERMGILGPEPTGKPVFFRTEMLPVSAVNDRGEDVLQPVLEQDSVAAPVGEHDYRFIGILREQHVLTLEFPQALDHHAGAPVLMIDGWVEYPYSQTNFAAWQAGVAYEAPSLEALVEGQWQMVIEQFGYPAGMPRRMSLPLADVPPGTRSLRLSTNMQVYWDRIAVVYAGQVPEHDKQTLPLTLATLGKTGFARRSNLDQFRPHYDYADRDTFWDTRYMTGSYTRLGPVEELVGTQDDAVAIIGPGEEVHLEFSSAGPAPSGWNRFFVLETNGWAKDMDLYTGNGETVGPLPSTGHPIDVRDRLHERYNTRFQSGY